MDQEIVVYTGIRCMPCESVKAYLKEHDVPFVEKNVHKDKVARAELLGMGYLSIPVTIIGDKHLQGFEPEQLKEALGIG